MSDTAVPRQQSPAVRPGLADSPQPPTQVDSDDICWCCQGQTVKRHCKIVCANCGFMRDCSDP